MSDAIRRATAETFILECEINGQNAALDVAPAERLLSVLRDGLGLTGTKRSCEIGRCGACMVLIDGQPVNSCLTMAYQCAGKKITTIEGLSSENGLNAVQKSFLEEGGYQCGYCTPGMVVTVTALLRENPRPTTEDIEEALSGNICRCTGYAGILRSVRKAMEASGEGGASA